VVGVHTCWRATRTRLSVGAAAGGHGAAVRSVGIVSMLTLGQYILRLYFFPGKIWKLLTSHAFLPIIVAKLSTLTNSVVFGPPWNRAVDRC